MHVLVTGASSGIGEAVVKAFASAGFDVTLVARRRAEIERVARETGGKVGTCTITRDLSELEGLEDVVREAEHALGPIDVLVNNAGFAIVGKSDTVDITDSERLLRVNLLAPSRLTRAVLPSMAARGNGVIVNISSVAAFAHPPYQTHYSMSKAGLAAMSVSLRSEMRKKGVNVVTVFPGPCRTAMGEYTTVVYVRDPTGPLPWGNADVLAGRIVRAVRRKRGTIVYPRFYWIVKLFPGIARRAIDLTPIDIIQKNTG